MRNIFQQKLSAYLLSMAVLFTMGMNFDTSNNHNANSNKNYHSVAKIDSSSSERIVAEVKDPVQAVEIEVEMEVQEQPKLSNEVTEIAIANYEVTAYFLNVRASADAEATTEIIDVVKQGSILEVIEASSNGWLKLKLAGYVHGKYAKLISEPTKQSARVRILSVEPTAATVAFGLAEEISKELQPVNNPEAEPQSVSNPEEATQLAEELVEKYAAAPNKPTSIVKSQSSLTEEHIAQIFEGTALSGHELEKAILEIEQEYGINAYFTIAVMKLESGHGKSLIARNKNNMFGLNAIDSDSYNKAFSFETKGESVQKFGQLIANYYIEKGYTSIEKVAGKYCQANPKWPILVKSIMESDYKKLL